jgi:4-oxalocrotonate tautomerase
MPHVIVRLWPGKSEEQKQRLAEQIAQDVMEVLGYGAAPVSVAMEEIDAAEWGRKVHRPDIVDAADRLYKKPGYTM